MKFLATSDLHGYLPKVDTPFDLMMICGDVCPNHDYYYAYQISWIEDEFVEWINSLPFKTPWSKVVMTWGNHDFVGMSITHSEIKDIERMTNGRLVILCHDIYEFEYPVSDGLDSLTIFGTPYCSRFGNWAFMEENGSLERHFSQIPEDTDILLSHDSPNVYKMGEILNGKWKSSTTGNKVLPKHIERVRPIIFHSGHFHSGNHAFEKRNGTWMANVSIVDEASNPFYPILEYDFDEETKTVRK